MKHLLSHAPSYTTIEFTLEAGESIRAEAGAMIYMDDAFEVKTTMGTGLLSALARRILGGESMFFNTYTARANSAQQGAKLGLAPQFAGDIARFELKSESLILQKGAYLCSDPSIQVKTKFGGLKSFFSREGVFLLEASGSGQLFITSYGAIVKKEINGEYILDTGHLVAFEPSLNYRVQKTGSIKSTLFSGEGLTMRFEGAGAIWIQTRVRKGFLDWIMSFLPR